MNTPPSIGDTVVVNGVTARVVSAGTDIVCVAVSRPDALHDVYGYDYYELYWVPLGEVQEYPQPR